MTLVVFNSQDPDSVALAQFYAQKREIPEDNLIGLETSRAEEISREEYNRTLAGPLRSALIGKRFWKMRGNEVVATRIRYVVLIRGVPLKIRTDMPPAQPGEERHPVMDRDESSVDSEMTVLGANQAVKGALNNPYFRSELRAVNGPIPPGMLLVCRLDAPDVPTVQRMITDSLQAERRGLWGWSYVDLRGLTSGPYYEGDQWLQNAVESMRQAGLPVQTDRVEATWPTGFPMEEAAIYYGWYAADACGPLADPVMRFVPGGVAVHIHSFSAATVRSTKQGWVGPLLTRGAAATVGNVYEPYLSLTAHLDVFQARLMAGLPLADAAYAATPVLSWMGVVLGDPLYQPYSRWEKISPERMRRGNEWEQFRELVRERQGNWVAAAPFLISLGKSLHNPMPLQAVGVWQLDRGEAGAAARELREAIPLAVFPWQRAQATWFLVRALEANKQKKDALRAIEALFREDLPPAQQALWVQERQRLSNE